MKDWSGVNWQLRITCAVVARHLTQLRIRLFIDFVLLSLRSYLLNEICLIFS